MPTTLEENISPEAEPDYRLLNSLKVPLSRKAAEGNVVPLLNAVARPPSVQIQLQPKRQTCEQPSTHAMPQSATERGLQPSEPTRARRLVFVARNLMALLAAAAVGYGGAIIISQLPSARAPASWTGANAPRSQALSSNAVGDTETVRSLPAADPGVAPATVTPAAFAEAPSAPVVPPQAAPGASVNEASNPSVVVTALPAPVPPVNETVPMDTGKEMPQTAQAMPVKPEGMPVKPEGMPSCQGALAAMQLCELGQR